MSRPACVSAAGYRPRVPWHDQDFFVHQKLATPCVVIRSLCKRVLALGFADVSFLPGVWANQQTTLILPGRAADKLVAVQLLAPIGSAPAGQLEVKSKE